MSRSSSHHTNLRYELYTQLVNTLILQSGRTIMTDEVLQDIAVKAERNLDGILDKYYTPLNN